MKHDDYIARRLEREPEFRQELAIATAELALATAIAKQRTESHVASGDLAERIGVSEDRLAAIEEADQISLAEVLRIANVLGITVSVEPGFRLTALATGASPIELRRIS